MSVDVDSQLLSVVEERPLGVRELSRVMRKRTQVVVSMIKRMEAGGLVEVTTERGDGRGDRRGVSPPRSWERTIWRRFTG